VITESTKQDLSIGRIYKMAIVSIVLGLFYAIVLFCIVYLVIKRAVKDGILEAHQEIEARKKEIVNREMKS
jgi:uncharacterized membrane protein